MGVAYFVVAESEVEGFDPVEAVPDGKSVARANDALDRIAAGAGVPPLISFTSMNPEDAARFFDWLPPDERDPDEPYPIDGGAEPRGPESYPPEEWFDPHVGLVTIRALIHAVENDPTLLTAGLRRRDRAVAPEDVLDDLRCFDAALERLAAADVRWHLVVDI